MVLIKSFVTGALYGLWYDPSKPIYVYLNEGDKVGKCYSCLNFTTHAHLLVCFFKIFFIRHVWLKQFYWYKKLLPSSTIFKRRNEYEAPCDLSFSMKFFKTQFKKTITPLRIVTVKKPELTFLVTMLVLIFEIK